MDKLLPYTYAMLTAAEQSRIRVAVAGSGIGKDINDHHQLAIGLGQFIMSALNSEHDGATSPTQEVCRFEMKRHELLAQATREQSTKNPEDIVFSRHSLGPMTPTLRDSVEIVRFGCDVESIIVALENKETIPSVSQPIQVLFHPGSLPLRVNDPTAYLLRLLAAETATMDEVFDAVLARYYCEDQQATTQLLEGCLSVLEGLYWEGIVEFESPHETTLARV